ncbi:MAG TPA: alpha/beta hydrolase [Steroidobacteraceae bacterium]|nr:alpha/beta hydrolase [Steroidobacteraceae bacterium]
MSHPVGSSEANITQLAQSQAAANSHVGPRSVPGRVIPVPTDVSPELQTAIAAPYSGFGNPNPPRTNAEWKQEVATSAAAFAASVRRLRERLGVSSQETTIGGVHAYILQPKEIPLKNRNRLLFNMHGGAWVFFPGESGTEEAVLMAAYGKFKVISIDYRMAPDFPYPAAMDDAMTAWKSALRMVKPANIGVFGTSAGGTMTLALVLRAKKEGLPLPGAIAPGSPLADADQSKAGDSHRTNEWLDNVLVSVDGPTVQGMNQLYFAGHDLKDPQLSPIYGDFHGFPPAILTTGTRDVLLSDTVRIHRKLREAGVDAELQVFEGMSHAQYVLAPTAPESKEAFEEIARFFDTHLGK